jgi:molybdopterin converting factor small subunit
VSVTLRLPSVLKVAVGSDHLQVTGRTVGEALDDACEALPNLRQHILLATGELRPHVLCLVNGSSLLRDGFADHELRDGDEILIHQAISGG